MVRSGLVEGERGGGVAKVVEPDDVRVLLLRRPRVAVTVVDWLAAPVGPKRVFRWVVPHANLNSIKKYFFFSSLRRFCIFS